MKLIELSSYLDSAVPLSYQENYDNSGLQAGMPEKEVNSALIALEVTDEVLNEAIMYGCDTIITHHPLIFNGLKKITSASYTGRILIRAIKNDIAIYSSHTNLDVFENGVSRKMAEKIGLRNIRILAPLKNRLLKLVTFVPEAYLDKVREALFDAGAGIAGNYDRTAFCTTGEGSFRAGSNATPFVGTRGKMHFEKEIRFETILSAHLRGKVIKALLDTHPYEEVAYDIIPLENENQGTGMGCTGEFDTPLDEAGFLRLISTVFNSKGVRYSKLAGKMIAKIAVCGGAGANLTMDAIAAGADAFVTGDIKYHNFFDADNRLLLVDAGHYESEKFATEILYDLVIKKFPKFAVRFSEINTNPINYL